MGLQSKISPNLISMDLTANAMLAQAPAQSKRSASHCNVVLKRCRQHKRYLRNSIKSEYPEQGFNCSHLDNLKSCWPAYCKEHDDFLRDLYDPGGCFKGRRSSTNGFSPAVGYPVNLLVASAAYNWPRNAGYVWICRILVVFSSNIKRWICWQVKLGPGDTSLLHIVPCHVAWGKTTASKRSSRRFDLKLASCLPCLDDDLLTVAQLSAEKLQLSFLLELDHQSKRRSSFLFDQCA
jgi:hypothetical protein